MERLTKRVRVEEVEISDDERNYGRTYAGRVGRIEGVREESGGGGFGGGIKDYTVRLEDGELITVRPDEVRFL